jgi:hypothetical protein|tara:strand:+ start:544 stop:897 length:354 start_codon:yes stop_codon:yes gene_type:complete
MELVAILGEDKENWGQVTGLINNKDWEKIILIKTKSATSYLSPKKADSIIIDSSKPLTEMIDFLLKELKGKFLGFEAHLSMASGNGKEHMALISALMKVPLGVRLAAFTKKGVEIIN